MVPNLPSKNLCHSVTPLSVSQTSQNQTQFPQTKVTLELSPPSLKVQIPIHMETTFIYLLFNLSSNIFAYEHTLYINSKQSTFTLHTHNKCHRRLSVVLIYRHSMKHTHHISKTPGFVTAANFYNHCQTILLSNTSLHTQQQTHLA